MLLLPHLVSTPPITSIQSSLQYSMQYHMYSSCSILCAQRCHRKLSVWCVLQFIYKSCPKVMDPQRPEIQECFLRAGAECSAWRYTWKVRISHCCLRPLMHCM